LCLSRALSLASLRHTYFFLTSPSHLHIYPLSLHDALPISSPSSPSMFSFGIRQFSKINSVVGDERMPSFFSFLPNEKKLGIRSSDRKSTRLNSSHVSISYAVFCLKKKNK